jgi:hypothetical protein
MVSHASFGVDAAGGTFGAEAILTTDYALKQRFEQQFSLLNGRFERMTCQLRLPYRDAALPAVLRPEELLEFLQG